MGNYWEPHEIIPHLWLGCEEHVKEGMIPKGCKVLDVRGYTDVDDYIGGLIPAYVLDALADLIHCYVERGKDIFVHCTGGIERSPLTVAWYLVRHGGFPDLETAYKYIFTKHMIARRRGKWVSWKEREERGMFGRRKDNAKEGSD